MLGPADALGLSEKGYTNGMIWFLGPIGAALAQIVAGVFFVHKIKTSPGAPQTVGDIFAARFGNSSRCVVGILVFIQAIAFAGLLILAGAQILNLFIGLPKVYGIIFIAIGVGVTTAIGGLANVVKTDIFQSILIIAMLIVIFFVTLTLLYSAPTGWRPPLNTPGFELGKSLTPLVGVFFTYFLGELLLPLYAQRALMAKTPNAARVGFIFAGVLAGIWYVVVTLSGVVAQLTKVENPEFVLLGNIVAVAGSSGPLAWMLAATAFISLLALTHSTFDATLNTGGTTFVRDFLGSFLKLSSDQQGFLARIMMIVISALGMIVPFVWSDLIDILLVGYTIWAPTLMPIFAWIILTRVRQVSSAVFWYAFIAGIAGWLLSPHFLGNVFPAVLAGVLLNLVVLLVSARWYDRRTAFVA